MSVFEISKRVSRTLDSRQRLQVWVSETSDNLPAAVFVYQRVPAVPLAGADARQQFVHIASYSDLLTFPQDAPAAGGPYFRLRRLDLIFDSLYLLQQTWDSGALQLRNMLHELSRFSGQPEVTYREVSV